MVRSRRSIFGQREGDGLVAVGLGIQLRCFQPDPERGQRRAELVGCVGADGTHPGRQARCGFYDTGPQFIEILRHEHNDAIDHGDHNRAQIFTGLLDGIDDTR
jgi:hypothetical protein